MTISLLLKMSIELSTRLMKYSNQFLDEILVYNWLITKINWNKISARIILAEKNPNTTIKCVLLEYAHPTFSAPMQIKDCVPFVGVPVDNALNSLKFTVLFSQVFADSNPKIKFYTRRKILNGNTPDENRKQFVMVIEPNAFEDGSAMLEPPMKRTKKFLNGMHE